VVERVVILKWVVAGIVGRVYVDEFNLAGIDLFQRMENEEIIAFDKKIIIYWYIFRLSLSLSLL